MKMPMIDLINSICRRNQQGQATKGWGCPLGSMKDFAGRITTAFAWACQSSAGAILCSCLGQARAKPEQSMTHPETPESKRAPLLCKYWLKPKAKLRLSQSHCSQHVTSILLDSQRAVLLARNRPQPILLVDKFHEQRRCHWCLLPRKRSPFQRNPALVSCSLPRNGMQEHHATAW